MRKKLSYEKALEAQKAADLLRTLRESGIIGIEGEAKREMEQKLKETIALSRHPYEIFQGRGADKRWKTYLPDDTKKSGRRLIARTSRKELMRTLYDFYSCDSQPDTHTSDVTAEELFQEWFELKSLHGAASTYALKIMGHWQKYYKDNPSKPDITHTPLQALTKLDYDRWIHETIDRFNLTKKEYTNLSVIIRGIISYAIDRGLLQEDAFSKVKINPKKYRKVRKKADGDQVFNAEELRELERIITAETKSISNLNGRNQDLIPLAILFQLQTGLRVGELAALRYEDISGDRQSILVQRMYRFSTGEISDHTKGVFGDRRVLLTAKAKGCIEEARRLQTCYGLPNDGYIFSVSDNPPSYKAFARRYERYCDMIHTSHKSSHAARRTFVSALLSGGANLNTVRLLCGHTDEKTTLNCYCYDMSSEQEKRSCIETALTW